jgi:hypothetical protein
MHSIQISYGPDDRVLEIGQVSKVVSSPAPQEEAVKERNTCSNCVNN